MTRCRDGYTCSVNKAHLKSYAGRTGDGFGAMSIVAKRAKDGVTQYSLKWSDRIVDWVNAQSLACLDLIHDFEINAIISPVSERGDSQLTDEDFGTSDDSFNESSTDLSNFGSGSDDEIKRDSMSVETKDEVKLVGLEDIKRPEAALATGEKRNESEAVEEETITTLPKKRLARRSKTRRKAERERMERERKEERQFKRSNFHEFEEIVRRARESVLKQEKKKRKRRKKKKGKTS